MQFKITRKKTLILTGLHPAGEVLESGELDHVGQPCLGLVGQKPTVPVLQNNT